MSYYITLCNTQCVCVCVLHRQCINTYTVYLFNCGIKRFTTKITPNLSASKMLLLDKEDLFCFKYLISFLSRNYSKNKNKKSKKKIFKNKNTRKAK